VVRERRATEIDGALGRHLAGGGGAVFVTVTARHKRSDPLAGRLAMMTEAFGLVLSGQPWKRRAARLGYLGLIRATEITWGEANGWHPHSHGVLLFERPLTALELADLDGWLRPRWAGVVERRGFGTVNRHSVDVRAVTSAGELSSYLTTVEGGWGVGLELARSDLKRGGDRLTPVEILRRLVELGETRWMALWLEYEAATFGKRAIVWSPGLKARLQVDEVDDVEAAAAEGADEPLVVAVFSAEDWRRALVAGSIGQVLSEVEEAAAFVIGLFRLLAIPLRPLDLGTKSEREAA
jgi:hypothetical protein